MTFQRQLEDNAQVKAESLVSLRLPVRMEGSCRVQLSPCKYLLNTCEDKTWIALPESRSMKSFSIAHEKRKQLTQSDQGNSLSCNMRDSHLLAEERNKNKPSFVFLPLHCNERLLSLFPARFNRFFCYVFLLVIELCWGRQKNRSNWSLGF